MDAIIETERLILREMLPSDLDGMFALESDANVHRYIGQNPKTSKAQVAAVIDVIRKQYTENGIGRWAVLNKDTNEFIGWSGLKFVKEETNNHIDYYDLGYRLRTKFWGQGFATETAFASLQYGFEKLNAPSIYAMADVENKASNKVLQKAGLRYIETFSREGSMHYWYEITLDGILQQNSH